MRRGVSLMEIIMLIFTAIVVAAVLFPLKILDVNQAERIAKWKSYYPELVYCYDVMQKSEKDFVNAYKTDTSLSAEKYFEVFSKYLGVDKEKTAALDLKNYKKRFKNGKKVTQNSKFNTNQIYCLRNDIVISYAGLQRDSLNSPIGILFVDIDKKITRNFIGRDVFVVLIYPDKIEPYGYNSSRQAMKEDCSPVGSGLQCSAYYLVGGSF